MTQSSATAPEAWHDEAFKATLETVLHTRRLVLEPLTEAHADELWLPLADPRLYVHVPQDPPASLAALRERFALAERAAFTGRRPALVELGDARRHDGQCRGRVQATVTTEAVGHGSPMRCFPSIGAAASPPKPASA